MTPSRALPYSYEFQSANEYVDSLLNFCAASTIFQTLCGGVHILDFFTREPSLYHTVVPQEWREWLMARDSMNLLNLLMRDDLSILQKDVPPETLLKYIDEIRKHSLNRHLNSENGPTTKLPRHVAVGMIPKKIHEVASFADYVTRVAESVEVETGKAITHFVDFGSGQNYLGRTLASPPYNKHIVAVESKELNISGAKGMDILAGLAEREKVMRNKKVYRAQQDSMKPAEKVKEKYKRRLEKPLKPSSDTMADTRSNRELNTIYTPGEGKGYIQYVEHNVQDGDLSDVVAQIEKLKIDAPKVGLNLVNGDGLDNTSIPDVIKEVSKEEEIRLMAMSIHSCGNLSHHGIRSLLLNDTVHAIAIVGCCYNLLGERLGPPTYKLPLLRPTLRAINAPSTPAGQQEACDAHGFPMSERVATHNDGDGIRLNITSRMMAVQAPQNWTEKESDAFFTRHFYRALLQRVFLDYGVVAKIDHGGSNGVLESTEPVIIGSLRKGCYGSFRDYVRGALEKLGAGSEVGQRVVEKMGTIEDREIDAYAERYRDLKKELSVTWSLMAFSAGVVESLIVVDRWLFLKEHGDVVGDAWVEPVFDYKLSPRNLVVVGIKK